MCGLKDTTEYLSALNLEKGIQNYKTNLDSLNKIYKQHLKIIRNNRYYEY